MAKAVRKEKNGDLYGMSPGSRIATRFLLSLGANIYGSKLRKISHRILIKEERSITMPDGIKLHAFIVRPRAPGKYPVILVRSPYVVNDFVYRALLPVLAKRGYACVLNTVRGALNSEGQWLPFENEREDGVAVIDWISKQVWCDGKIGGYGGSYLGYTQWSYADCGHPALKTLCIDNAGGSAYHTFWRRGMFRQEIWTLWATQMMGQNRMKFLLPSELYQKAYHVEPQIDLGERIINERCPWYCNWISNDHPNDTYWAEGYWGQMNSAVQNIRIPLMLSGGWFDIFIRPQLEAFRSLPKETQSKSRFFIGPWDHSGTDAGDKPFKNSEKGGNSHLTEVLEWFDYQLKGMPYSKQLGTIEAFDVGTDSWSSYESDIQPASHERFYFAPRSAQCPETAAGMLAKTKPASRNSAMFTFDPNNPVESICGNVLGTGEKTSKSGPKEQRKIGERPDILSFVSESLENSVQLCGRIKVGLTVSSDAPATAFAVCVSEMEANGHTYNIRDDITDIRWRDEHTVMQYTPGECVHLELELPDICWLIQKGSRIRVDISSSNFPMYHVHPNTTEPWGKTQKKIVAEQTVYMGADTASYIEIPIK